MMNQMFGSFQTGGRPESVVSEERLNEIFTVQKTADLWNEILLHPNYDNMFGRAARFISQKSGKPFSEVNDFVEKTIKESNVSDAKNICAQKGGTFDEAMQDVLQQFLDDLDKKSAEEIANVSSLIENLVDMLCFIEELHS